MSTEKFHPPQRVRCVNAESSFGVLAVNRSYSATYVFYVESDGTKMVTLAEVDGWWSAARFVAEEVKS